MSEKKPAALNPADKPAPPVARRISNPRAKKIPGNPAPTPTADDIPATNDPVAATAVPSPDSLPAAASAQTHPGVPQPAPAATGEWPEPDAATAGGPPPHDGKRKRRRRKGKGQTANATEDSQPSNETAETTIADAPKPPRSPQQAPRQPAARVKIDPAILARKAWKIFLAEVSEEGVALIGDQDARELAHRCFRLTEIFTEEQARRLPGT
jgi:hypothetical protein